MSMDESPLHDDDILTTDEAARMLRLHRRTMYQKVREQRIPYLRVGREIRFSRSALSAWMRGNGATPVTQESADGSSVQEHVPTVLPSHVRSRLVSSRDMVEELRRAEGLPERRRQAKRAT